MRINETDATEHACEPAALDRSADPPLPARARQTWAEQELLRLNRALRVLSACNRAVSATCDEPDLLQQGSRSGKWLTFRWCAAG